MSASAPVVAGGAAPAAGSAPSGGSAPAGPSPANPVSAEVTIDEFILQTFPRLEPAIGADVIAVVGSSDDGKSALVNYLLNTPMMRRKIGPKWRVVTKDPRHERAKIGTRAESQTFYTTVYRNHVDPSTAGLAVCDCPGFEDTRTATQQLYTQINTQLLLKAAKTIKLVFVLSYSTLFEQNGSGFREAIHSLAALFKCNSQTNLAESIVFAITKLDCEADPPTKEDVQEQVDQLLSVRKGVLTSVQNKISGWKAAISNRFGAKPSDEDRKKWLTTLSPEEVNEINQANLDAANDAAAIQVLEAMKAHSENIILVNYKSDLTCQSRKDIIARLRSPQIPALQKDQLEVSNHDNLRVWFQAKINAEIEKVLKRVAIFEERKSLSDEIAQEQEQVDSALKMKTVLSALTNQSQANAGYQAQMNSIATQYHQLLQLQKQEQANFNALLATTHQVEAEIAVLDTDEELEGWSDSIHNEGVWGFFSAILSPIISGKDFKFDLQVPYVRVKPEFPKGHSWIPKAEDSAAGTYYARYKPSWFEASNAKATAFVQKRFHDGNPILIRNLKLKLARLQKQLASNNEAIQDRTATMSQLESKYSNTQKLTNVEAQLGAAQKRFALLKAALQKIPRPSYTGKDAALCYAVAGVCRLLNSGSALIRNFLLSCVNWNGLDLSNPEPLLHWALQFPQQVAEMLVRILCAHRADLDAKDVAGDTPLHVSISKHLHGLAVELILRGANIDLRDQQGRTPLQLLLECVKPTDKQHSGSEDFRRLLALFLSHDHTVPPEVKQFDAIDDLLHRLEFISFNNQALLTSVPSILGENIISTDVKVQFPKKDHEEAFQALFDIEWLAPLLEIAAFGVLGLHSQSTRVKPSKLTIRVDPKVPNVDDASLLMVQGSLGVLYLDSNRIFLGGDRSQDDKDLSKLLLAGTLIHELTHFVANDIFRNRAKPYLAEDKEAPKTFAKFYAEAKSSSESIVRGVFGKDKDGNPCYTPDDYDAELIVRIPQLIAMKRGNLEEVAKACPMLFQYFANIFLPQCREHLWTLRKKHLILPLEREQPRSVALFDAAVEQDF